MGTQIPSNTATFSVDELVQWTGGRLLQPGASGEVRGVCTDTRTLEKGNAFVALRGEKSDAHAFVDQACQLGAAALIVSQPVSAPPSVSVVLVPDTLEALGKLGREHRRRWAEQVRSRGGLGKVVAVTGSAGKTTTCRAIAAALQSLLRGRLHMPVGNLNNAIGVPMVLLGLESSHDCAIVEIGTNAPGEISYGAGLAQPDVAVITLVSCAHSEGLGSIEAIAFEKGAILEALGPDGIAVANIDDPWVRAQLARIPDKTVVRYGLAPECEVRLVSKELLSLQSQRLAFDLRQGSWKASAALVSPLLGNAGAYASAAALAVSLALFGPGLDVSAVTAGLGAVRGESGRLRPKELPSGLVVIDDVYNANPASMADSLRLAGQLAALLGRRLVAVLGEMRELGTQAEAEHERIGQLAAEVGASEVLAVAGHARRIANRASELGVRAHFVPAAEQAAEHLKRRLHTDDLVLIKGSRGVALERVVRTLEVQGGAGNQ